MTDTVPTVLDRLVAAGRGDEAAAWHVTSGFRGSHAASSLRYSPPRAQEHLAAGLVRVDGQVGDGPGHPAPPPSRVVIDGAEYGAG